MDYWAGEGYASSVDQGVVEGAFEGGDAGEGEGDV